MIRTPEQYLKSLNDGRVIYIEGERVKDVTKNPLLKGPVIRRALAYVLANDPKYRDLITVEESGERVMFLFRHPKSAQDLIRRRNIYILSHRIGAAMSGMGPDALAASSVVAAKMDKALGTHYRDAVEDYRQHLKKTDPAITGAITDVKGNRSIRPSAQAQHKDFYVRVVDHREGRHHRARREDAYQRHARCQRGHRIALPCAP